MSGFGDFATPVLIEPPFYLTCCIIWSNEFPLTLAAEGVKKLLIEFVKEYVETTKRPGAVWLD
jgi:LysR family transcriptional regulator, nitrogen assimilation regulatory protein